MRQACTRSNSALSRLSSVTSENSDSTWCGRSAPAANCGTDGHRQPGQLALAEVVEAEHGAVDDLAGLQCPERRQVMHVQHVAVLVDDFPVARVQEARVLVDPEQAAGAALA